MVIFYHILHMVIDGLNESTYVIFFQKSKVISSKSRGYEIKYPYKVLQFSTYFMTQIKIDLLPIVRHKYSN